MGHVVRCLSPKSGQFCRQVLGFSDCRPVSCRPIDGRWQERTTKTTNRATTSHWQDQIGPGQENMSGHGRFWEAGHRARFRQTSGRRQRLALFFHFWGSGLFAARRIRSSQAPLLGCGKNGVYIQEKRERELKITGENTLISACRSDAYGAHTAAASEICREKHESRRSWRKRRELGKRAKRRKKERCEKKGKGERGGN